MTSRQTRKTSRSRAAAAQTLGPVAIPWTDVSGTSWAVTGHWAVVEGRATLVGLDIRGFPEWNGAEYEWLAGQPAEVTQRVLRELPISKVREQMRAKAATNARHNAGLASKLLPPGREATAIVESYAATAAAYTAQGEPRRRLPTASPGLLEEVARLYLAAVATGDKTPAKSVESALRSAGAPVSEHGGRDQVRKWIQRARERGLIPPTTERKWRT